MFVILSIAIFAIRAAELIGALARRVFLTSSKAAAASGSHSLKASDVPYIKSLAAPFTVNTMPEETLKALADHGDLSEIMSADGGDCEALLDQFAAEGIDIDDLAAKLQDDGAKSFVTSWNELMGVIASKSAALAKAG